MDEADESLCPTSLEVFLFDRDAVVLQVVADARLKEFQNKVVNNPRLQRPRGGTLKWIAQHRKLFKSHGVPWVEPIHNLNQTGYCGYRGYEELELTCGWYAMLSDRQKHLIIFIEDSHPLNVDNYEWQLTDVSQDGSYLQPVRYNTCPVLTPRCQIWIRRAGKKGRLMLGSKKMLL